MRVSDVALRKLVDAIVSDDLDRCSRMLEESPGLTTARFEVGASRQNAKDFFLHKAQTYIYAGDTALHMAAAAFRVRIAKLLIDKGANVRARNRHGSEPLHSASVGQPGFCNWNPEAQAETIALLIRCGADPNAVDKRGVAPLHRAVRTRCGAAVRALLDHGANPELKNASDSTPIKLAMMTTGRGGSGSAAAKAEQKQILALLEERLSGLAASR